MTLLFSKSKIRAVCSLIYIFVICFLCMLISLTTLVLPLYILIDNYTKWGTNSRNMLCSVGKVDQPERTCFL